MARSVGTDEHRRMSVVVRLVFFYLLIIVVSCLSILPSSSAKTQVKTQTFFIFIWFFFLTNLKKEKKHEIWSCSDCRYAINTVLVCVCVLEDVLKTCLRLQFAGEPKKKERNRFSWKHILHISLERCKPQNKSKTRFFFSFSFFLSWKDHLDRRDMTRRMVYTLDFPFCRDMEERGDVYSRIEPDTKPQQIPASGCCVTHSRSP